MKTEWTLSNQAKAELEKNELVAGCRIYYGGDMANAEGFGTIAEVKASRFGTSLVINYDDGRTFTVSACIFSTEYEGHGGTKFVTLAAYNDYRNERLRAAGYNDEMIKRHEAK